MRILGECIDPGCTRQATRRNLCNMHYRRRKRSGEELPPRVSKRIAVPGYIAAHERLGKASLYTCSVCGKPARDWAYDNSDPDELVDPYEGLRYSLDPSRYLPMCRSCHLRHDRRKDEMCSVGHPIDHEDRYCRQCNIDGSKRRREVVKEAAAVLGLGYKNYIARYTASQAVAKEIIETNRGTP